MRSIWKGHIRFSLVTIPIQIFSAVESKNDISFKQIHEKDKGSVGYKKYCKSCEQDLQYGEIVKGYEYADDQFVVFNKNELDSIKLKSTKAIDIEAFVNINEVHPSRYEAVYFVGPNGDVAQKTFSLLITALKKSNKAGIGRIILRDKEDVVLLAPLDNAIVMYKLRYPYEIRNVNKVPDISFTKPADAELDLALNLISSLTTTFDKVDFKDRYKDALMDLVNTKISGKQIIALNDENTEAPVVDIMAALKESIEQAKKKAS